MGEQQGFYAIGVLKPLEGGSADHRFDLTFGSFLVVDMDFCQRPLKETSAQSSPSSEGPYTGLSLFYSWTSVSKDSSGPSGAVFLEL